LGDIALMIRVGKKEKDEKRGMERTNLKGVN